MTRNYTNTSTGIWRDEDFTGLTSSAQRTYWMLKSQSEISAAGTLALTIGRWAGKARDTTPASIRADLAELAEGRFVVYDEATEELLVRSFVRWDNGYGNPKRRPVILEAAQAVESLALRRVLAQEFQRLGLPIAGLTPQDPPPDGPSGKHPDRHPGSPTDSLSTDPNRSTSWDRTERAPLLSGAVSPQANSLSRAQSGRHTDSEPPSERVVVTKALYLEPQPTTLKPQPPPPSPSPRVAASAAVPPATPTPEEGEGEDPTQEQTLVAEIRAKRPEWSARSVIRAVRDPDVAERPWPVVAAAMRAVADDPESRAPGRIRGDGPWWNAAAQVRESTSIDPPCGRCGPNRQITTPEGRVARCPDCHPLRRAS